MLRDVLGTRYIYESKSNDSMADVIIEILCSPSQAMHIDDYDGRLITT
jgi:hypothetical protein